MKELKRLFWWIDFASKNRFSFFGLLLMCGFWLVAASVVIALFGREISPSENYAIYVGVTIYAFVQLSSELTLLARSEALRLLPGFECKLVSAARTCVLALLAGSLAIELLSGEPDWLSVSAVAYSAAVLAGLQLPTWGLQRSSSGNNFNAKYVGELKLSWPSMLALAMPAFSLHWLPVLYVSAAMVIAAAVLLLAMPRLMRGRKVGSQAMSSVSLWRRPGVVVFGVVCGLILAPLAHPWTGDHVWAPAMLVLALPWMGVTAMGRESQNLPNLLGRMWLAGRSRAEVCWIGLVRLLAAQAAEFGIYLGVAAVGCALGWIALPAMFNLTLILIVYGWINWTRGVNDILLGTENRRLRIDKPARKRLNPGYLLLPFVTLIVLDNVFPGLFHAPFDKSFLTVTALIVGAFAVFILVFAWNSWQLRVTEFSASNAENGRRLSEQIKGQSVVSLINLPFIALIFMAWMDSAEGLVFATLAVLSSVAFTLNYFHRRFEAAELW